MSDGFCRSSRHRGIPSCHCRWYCWWFRNPANHLRLVAYPMIYDGFYTSQVVIPGFLNHQQYCQSLGSPSSHWTFHPLFRLVTSSGDAAGHSTIDGCATSKGCIATGRGWKKVFTYKSWMHFHLDWWVFKGIPFVAVGFCRWYADFLSQTIQCAWTID